MLVGVPREVKVEEYRVGLTPESVGYFVARGHNVLVETCAGDGLNCSDIDYQDAGAEIVEHSRQIFETAEMIVKVKEPQAEELNLLQKDQILFTYLHLAPDPDQTRDLIRSGAICIAYETVTDDEGGLPLLTPMSQVAGRLSIQAGARCLEKEFGGSGVLLGGVPGVEAANVTVIGGGVVGENAIKMALGLGANITVLDTNDGVLSKLKKQYGPNLNTVLSTKDALETYLAASDLVIGAVLVAGAEAPKIVTEKMVKGMKKGSVLVDVAIDQGGCFETSRPTTHKEPTYIIDGVVHYCVANMPGAVPCTSTFALNNATLPYGISLADKGYKTALLDDQHLRNGLNVYKGLVTNKPVADALGLPYQDPEIVLNNN